MIIIHPLFMFDYSIQLSNNLTPSVIIPHYYIDKYSKSHYNSVILIIGFAISKLNKEVNIYEII